MGNSTNFAEIRERTIRNRNERLDTFIPKFEEILKTFKLNAERVDHITRLDVAGLVQELNKQSITSEQLVAIYGLRAATIGRRNCIIT